MALPWQKLLSIFQEVKISQYMIFGYFVNTANHKMLYNIFSQHSISRFSAYPQHFTHLFYGNDIWVVYKYRFVYLVFCFSQVILLPLMYYFAIYLPKNQFLCLSKPRIIRRYFVTLEAAGAQNATLSTAPISMIRKGMLFSRFNAGCGPIQNKIQEKLFYGRIYNIFSSFIK